MARVTPAGPPGATKTPQRWRNRIVDQGDADPSTLVANPKNWRTHPASQRAALRGALGEIGWVAQAIVNRTTGHVVDGHARIEEAIARGEPTVPVIYVELSQDEEDVVLATLDPIGALATSDGAKLSALLDGLKVDDAGLASLLSQLGGPKRGLTDPDEIPIKPVDVYVKPGDLYALGDHRLICGDARDREVMARLAGDARASLLVSSPPYNVGKGYSSHDDRMKWPAYWAMIDDVLASSISIMTEGSMVAWNVGVSPNTRPFDHCIALERAGLTWKRQIIWRKIGAAIPLWKNTVKRPVARHYQPNYVHEVIYLARRDEVGDVAEGHEVIFLASHGSIVEGGAIAPDNAFQHDVWELGQFGAGRPDHPAAFPVALPMALIVHLSANGETILDPFMGSGTAMIGAEMQGRRALGADIDPAYVQVAITRWEAFTGRKAELI